MGEGRQRDPSVELCVSANVQKSSFSFQTLYFDTFFFTCKLKPTKWDFNRFQEITK